MTIVICLIAIYIAYRIGHINGELYGAMAERFRRMEVESRVASRIEELADDDDFHARVKALMARQDREMGPKWPEDIDVTND